MSGNQAARESARHLKAARAKLAKCTRLPPGERAAMIEDALTDAHWAQLLDGAAAAGER